MTVKDFIEESEFMECILSLGEKEELKRRGYEILHKLNEGQTREAYLAKYVSGNVSKLRVVKVPKKEVDPSSICTLINKSKRDVDLAEVIASGEIQHPYIAEILDSFNLNGRTVNVEAYHEGTDLEALVKSAGPIKDESRFDKIFTQAIEAFEYLNEEKRILHRDIKPSNIIITKSGDIKVTDLQNAAKIFGIDKLSMPTRGGTPYTHIDLLNALITGRETRASTRTEVYALGAAMFNVLTGEDPFGYKIVADENGKEIKIGKEIYRIKLKDGDKDLEEITNEYHEEKLKKIIKKVPKKYKDVIYRCLTTNDKKAIKDMYRLKQEFSEIVLDYKGRFKESLIRGAKIALPTAVVLGLTIFGIIGGIRESKREHKPTLQEIMQHKDYSKFSLETLDDQSRKYSLDILVPYMKDVQERLPGFSEKLQSRIEFYSSHAGKINLMPVRLTSSWLRACYLNKGYDEVYKQKGEKRCSPSLVPLNFVLKTDLASRQWHVDDNEAIARGLTYLKHCLGPDANVADVYTNYFSTREDVNTAMVKTKSITYLPRFVPEENNPNIGSIEPGYGQAIPYHQRQLINTAISLYMITDEEGKVDFSKIPKLSFIEGTFKNQLNSAVK
ncbi:protein kinase [Candidatus Woesearchaeota archaeon]|nr:protein kinase [Candidatus Woesearchaeota archaeon]